jgi:predicted ATPase
LHVLRYELLTTAFMTAIAEGLAMMGRFDEAIRAIDETIAVVERNGDLFTMPELLRIKGSIFFSAQRFAPLEAEACFLTSLDLAARQSALAWELRTATSLALLRAGQGRRDEAREVLAPVYARFTEGLDNADLTAARNLLDDLN